MTTTPGSGDDGVSLACTLLILPDWSPKPFLEELACRRLDRLKQSNMDAGAAHTHYGPGLHPSPAYLVGEGDTRPRTMQSSLFSLPGGQS